MTEPWELPEGWEWASFQEVAQIASDLVSPAGHQDEPHIAPNHIESGSGRLLPYTTIAADKVTSPKHRFRPGQILYSKIRPYLCKAVLVDFGGLCSADMYPITAKIDAGYLHRWMLSLTFTEWASGAQGRTVLPKINQEALSVIQVPVPPLPEQRRIVAKIEELTARSRAARAAVTEVPTLLEQFRQSVLASAFRGDLTAAWRETHSGTEPASVLLDRIRDERRKQWGAKFPKKTYVEPASVDDSDLPDLPEGWCWVSLETIADVTGGITKDHKKANRPGMREVPYLRVANVQRGAIDLSELKAISASEADIADLRLAPGDVLFTEGGDRDKLGRGWVWNGEIDECIHQNHVFRARLYSAELLPQLVSHHGNTFGKDWFISVGKQTTNLASISLGMLRRFPVPVPPPTEQIELLKQIHTALARIEAAASVLMTVASDFNQLDQSVLAKAFCGELVPQDPADEPAASLLARIRSGGSAITLTTPPRSAKRGQVKAYILLLLRTWSKPLGREMLERGLVLMLNADVRRAILGRSKTTAKRTKKSNTPPQFVSGMDALLGEMLDDGWLVPGPEAGFFAEGQHGIDFTAAPPSDLDAVREVAEAIKVLHKDKQQATDADIVSALNGEIYELVS